MHIVFNNNIYGQYVISQNFSWSSGWLGYLMFIDKKAFTRVCICNFQNHLPVCEHHGISWNLVMEPNSLEHLKFHWIPWNFCFNYGDPMGFGVNFQGTFKVRWYSMELPLWPRNVPCNWEILKLINFIIREVYINVRCMISYHYLSYVRQSISGWNIEISHF